MPSQPATQKQGFLVAVITWLLRDAKWADGESYSVGFLMGIALAQAHPEYARAVHAATAEIHDTLSSEALHMSDLEELLEAVPLA